MHYLHPTNSVAATLLRPAKLIGLILSAAAIVVAACSPNGGALGGTEDEYMGTGSTGQMPAGTAEWCAVERILEERCQSCHNPSLPFGAPMPMMTHADMMATAPLAQRPVWQVAAEKIVATSRPMPPPPNARLNEAEIQTFQNWINAGLPAGNCDIPPPLTGNGGSVGNGGTGGIVGNGGSGNVGSTPGGGGTINTGGAYGTGGDVGSGGGDPDAYPPDCIDCGNYACTEGTPIAFRAHQHATPGDNTPFDATNVGANGQPNSYECFYYEAPWGPNTQLIGHRPIIDNERVIHHWLLYASNTPPLDLVDGGRRSYCQFQPDANRVLLAGWAPGTPGANLPPNVGQALPHGDRVFITLEVHYFNTQPGVPAFDRSGVEVCLTDNPRPNEATMHWLGTENINIPPNGTVTAGDTCTPNQGKSATILRVWPHMHLTGVHAKLDVIRSNGVVQNVHDGDFSFDNQTMYELPTPITVNPGDRLDARCTFQNPEPRLINFGEGSTEEMCYLFTLAYPAGALHNGKNGCLPGVGCVPGGVRRCIDNENILTAIGGL